MRTRSLASIFAVALCARSAAAQPATDIHLLSIERSPTGEVSLGSPLNATATPGYDNQPAFLPDGSAFLFSSIRGGGQSDIFRYELESGRTSRVTETAESEYSPTPRPEEDRFTTVRVEADGTQRLWSMSAEGRDARLVFEDIRAVGYHSFGEEGRLALFLVGEPHELHLARLGETRSRRVAQDIGTTLQTMPDTLGVSYLQRVGDDDDDWMLRGIDLESGEPRDLVASPPGARDHAWSPWGTVWMTSGSRILEWDPKTGAEWRELADLAGHGLESLTRLAFRPDGGLLALVAAEADSSD